MKSACTTVRVSSVTKTNPILQRKKKIGRSKRTYTTVRSSCQTQSHSHPIKIKLLLFWARERPPDTMQASNHIYRDNTAQL